MNLPYKRPHHMDTEIHHMITPQVHVPSRSVLALPGSLRRNGYNRRLLEAAALCAPPGTRVDVYDALSDVPLFDEDLEAATHGSPDSVQRLCMAVDAADGC